MSDDITSNQVIGTRDRTSGWNFNQHRIRGQARAAIERGQPSYFDVPLISPVIDNLWQGGCIGGVQLPDDFVNVISLYPWEKYRLGPDTDRTELTWYDFSEMPSEDELAMAVDLVAESVSEGKTLVHCQAGLNRSGLVAALYLIWHRNFTGQEAIGLLRAKRSPIVLCNETFEQWLLNEA